MNLEIFLTEHIPSNESPQKGTFWAMPFPAQIEVFEGNEQAVRDAVLNVFSESAPHPNQIPNGLYFQVDFQQKCISRGHIDGVGRIDSIVMN